MAHRVMIVEDALIISLHLKKLLEINGYEVVAQFTEAEKAVAHYESIRGQGIDLVFMDIMLDGRMDGIEAARLMQDVRAIPIIYLTALTDQTTIARAKETMPYGYLIKPFEEHALLTTLEMAIYKFKAEQEISLFQSRFLLTVNSLNEGVITTDQNFHLEFVNEAAKNILEIDLQEILGQGIHSFFQLISNENE